MRGRIKFWDETLHLFEGRSYFISDSMLVRLEHLYEYFIYNFLIIYKSFLQLFLKFHFYHCYRTFCLSLSPLIIVKSFPDLATRPSNCGTLWPSASTPSKKMDTVIGCRVYVSHQTIPTQLSSLLAGIVPSRSGIWPTASCVLAIPATLVTWTPSPFPQTAVCALPVERIAKHSCGTWMRTNFCIPWTTTTSSLLCASAPTGIGCVSPTVPQSKFGIWHARKLSRNCVQKLSQAAKPIPSACLWLGPPMVKLYLLDILITLSVYGKFLFQLVKEWMKNNENEINKIAILILKLNGWMKNMTNVFFYFIRQEKLFRTGFSGIF